MAYPFRGNPQSFSDLPSGGLPCISALNASNFFRLLATADIEVDKPNPIVLSVPGHGEIRKSQCGEVDHAVQCPNRCEKPILHQYSCHNMTCGCRSCVKSAIAQKASRIVRRHKMMNRLYSKKGINVGGLKHIVFSPDVAPDLDLFISDQGRSFRSEVISLIRKHSKDGFYAGTVFLHPFRYQHLDGSCCEDPECQADHAYAYSPHVHFLGHTFLQKSDLFHSSTAWIYKNIGPGERRSLFLTAAYELSHVGVFMQQKDLYFEGAISGKMWSVVGTVYSHVGLYSNAAGGREVLSSSKVSIDCSKCGRHMLEHAVTLKPTMDPDVCDVVIEENVILGEATEFEIVELWHLNVRQYQILYDDDEGTVRKRLPSKRIELQDTFRTSEDDHVDIED